MKRIVLKDTNVWKHEKHSPGIKEEDTMEILSLLQIRYYTAN